MASDEQIAANRRNATKSTGPRTEAGKARSRMNALRHGLARAVPGSDKGWDEQRHHSIAEISARLGEIDAAGVNGLDLAYNPATRASPDELEMGVRYLRRLERYSARAHVALEKGTDQ